VSPDKDMPMTPDFAPARRNMVDRQIRTVDVTDARVLEAFAATPREIFVPAAKADLAYLDAEIEVAPGRYCVAPAKLAKLVQAAAVRPGEIVLDIGCGTGYSAAVLARLAATVLALEPDSELARQAEANMAKLGIDNVVVVQGPPGQGWAREAPYDAIFIGGAIDEVGDAILGQLRPGGRLVAAHGRGNAGEARLHLGAAGHSARALFNCALPPMPGFAKARRFEL
jgi:protein-L-isoaspartate(D-aspartate) O-methyltransferase